jgi:hypothetical protein
LSGSCSGRKSKAGRKDIIPRKDLIEILTDINIANGLLGIPEINYKYRAADTLPVYNEIIAGHGYARAQMDKTMKYYFLRRPKKLISIYDKVLGKLSEMESRVDEEMPLLRAAEMNLWTGRKSYFFPDSAGQDTTRFMIPVSGQGIYDIRFTITVYPDDPVVNPGPDIYFISADTTAAESRIYLSSLPYLKDGLPHTCEMKLDLKQQKRGWIKGWFIGCQNSPERHLRIQDIYITPGLIQ